MSINKALFGTYNGESVFEYTLTGAGGLEVQILNLGGIIRSLTYRGTDVVHGFDSVEDYIAVNAHYGALVGRNANRIEDAEFELGGKIYKLEANNGKNNLHGGSNGFDKKIWSVQAVDGTEPSLVLRYHSPDDEAGFPGNVQAEVTYTLTADNELKIHYVATSDADTVFNMTSHSYFNLNGHASGSVQGHRLWLNSDYYLPNAPGRIATGEVVSVCGTPFDFSSGATLGEQLAQPHEQIEKFNGFDHSFALSGRGFRKVASLEADLSGIKMEVYTDRPAVQLYVSNGVKDQRPCKQGVVYGKTSALCLETQAFPNSIRFAHFPSPILKKRADI